jgi:hypothetical protein
MKNRIILIAFLGLISTIAQAQNHFFVQVGVALQNTKEMRIARGFKRSAGSYLNIGYERQTPKSINRISLLFMHSRRSNVVTFNNLTPEVRYEYLQRKGNWAIGGYADVGTMLSLASGAWANENAFSYCIWSSVGASASYEKRIGQNRVWQTKFSLPVLSYVVRPSYTFPYSDNFLTDEKFDLGRQGLAKAILTGGKLQAIGQFSNIKFSTAIHTTSANKKWDYGLQYQLSYLHASGLKALSQVNHQIGLNIQKIK